MLTNLSTHLFKNVNFLSTVFLGFKFCKRLILSVLNLKTTEIKKTITLMLTLLFSLCIYADPIELNKKEPPKKGVDNENDRSELIVPTATIENGVINLETSMSTWGVNVTIYNGDGVVVYNAVSAEESMQHSFAVGTLSADDYIIEVQIGEDYYEGEFSIN